MKTTALALLFFLASVLSTYAQKEANNWYFGTYAGLTFKNGTPEYLEDGKLLSWEGCSAISDKTTGELLFYTDGISVWNRLHQVMQNGTGLNGGPSSTQNAIIVSHPSNSDIYYVFNAGDLTRGAATRGLWYSIVDMKLDGGLGAITTKNTRLIDSTGEKVDAALHCNGRDVWIVTQQMLSGVFYSFLLTSSGVSPTPVISPGLGVQGQGLFTYRVGYLRLSPNGRMIASASDRGMMLANYNNATGQVYNPFFFHDEADEKFFACSVAFSPDNLKLYTTELSPTGDRRLVQFNLEVNSKYPILSSMKIISDKYCHGSEPMSLGPDGKLYIGMVENTETDYLSVVDNPNLAGTACGYQHRTVSLGGRSAGLSLPNFPSYFFDRFITRTNYDTVCQSEDIVFQDTRSPEPSEWQWAFPGGAPASFTGKTPPPVSYKNAGSYKAFLVTGNPCLTDTTIWEIVVKPQPHIVVTGNTVICPGTSTQLFASGGTSYIWSPATGLNSADIANPVVTTTQTTLYTITADNSFGCLATTNVLVKVQATVGWASGGIICRGDSVELKAGGGAFFEWSPPDGLSSTTSATPKASPEITTRYRVIVRQSVCSDTAWCTVQVRDRVVASVSNDTAICAGDAVQLLAGGGMSYEWSPAEGLDRTDIPNPIARPTTTTRYTVKATNDGGCSDEKSILVTVSDNIVLHVAPPPPLCVGDGIRLSATGAEDYHWEPAALLDNPNIATPFTSPTETTVFTVTGTRGMCIGSTTVIVTVLPRPSVTTGLDTSICIGGAAQLQAFGADTYLWSPSDGLSKTDIANPIASPTQTTLYTVRGRNAAGCEMDAQVEVTIRDKQKVIISIGQLDAPPGGRFTIPVIAEVVGGGKVDIPTLDIQLRFDADLIELIGIHPSNAVVQRQGMEYVVSISLRDLQVDGSTAVAEIQCLTLLSPQHEAIIRCTAAIPQDDCLIIESINGIFQRDAFCGFAVRHSRIHFITVSPIPAQDEVTVQLHNMTEEAMLQLLDTYGRLLHEQNVLANTERVILDIRPYSNGLYVLKTLSSGQTFTSMISIVR